MRVLIAACCPSAGEALAPVAIRLASIGHHVNVVAVGPGQPPSRFFGSAQAFCKAGVAVRDLAAEFPGPVLDDFPLEIAQGILAELQVDAVLTGVSRDASGLAVSVEDAVIAAAVRNGLRSLRFIDSWNAYFRRRAFAEEAGHLAVPDRVAGEIVALRGGPAERITITGNPGWESFATDDAASPRPPRPALPPGGRLLAFFGNVTTDNAGALGWLMEASTPADRVEFRPHIRDRRDYRQVMAPHLDRIITTTVSSDNLVRTADVVLSHGGATVLKAALSGGRAITIANPAEDPDLIAHCGRNPLAALGGSIEARSIDDLRAALSRPDRPDIDAVRAALNVDFRSVERIVALLGG